ncbi:MAG: hypothetical protein ACI915_002327 [Gammaproteobacteria bacterium]
MVGDHFALDYFATWFSFETLNQVVCCAL